MTGQLFIFIRIKSIWTGMKASGICSIAKLCIKSIFWRSINSATYLWPSSLVSSIIKRSLRAKSFFAWKKAFTKASEKLTNGKFKNYFLILIMRFPNKFWRKFVKLLGAGKGLILPSKKSEKWLTRRLVHFSLQPSITSLKRKCKRKFLKELKRLKRKRLGVFDNVLGISIEKKTTRRSIELPKLKLKRNAKKKTFISRISLVSFCQLRIVRF